jgi:hypothetical protein
MLARQNNLSENSKWLSVVARMRRGAGLSQLGTGCCGIALEPDLPSWTPWRHLVLIWFRAQ